MPTEPQDHKPKAKAEAHPDKPFVFEHAGELYELAAADDVLTAGYARKNRHKSLDDQLFSMLEELADERTLEAIDSMHREEFTDFQRDFFDHIGVDLGEERASSRS